MASRAGTKKGPRRARSGWKPPTQADIEAALAAPPRCVVSAAKGHNYVQNRSQPAGERITSKNGATQSCQTGTFLPQVLGQHRNASVPATTPRTPSLLHENQPTTAEELRSGGGGAFSCHSHCFERCRRPMPGDWLDDVNEPGQTFRQFLRKSMKAVPHGAVKVIEMVLVGPFDPGKAPDVKLLLQYAAAFFVCEVRLGSKWLPLSAVCGPKRPPGAVGGPRRGDEGQLQLECGDVFEGIRSLGKKRDVLCSVAITMADLYPVTASGAWNFVFGQAVASDGIGCFSFSRYSQDHATGAFPIPWEGHPGGGRYGESEGRGTASFTCGGSPTAAGGGEKGHTPAVVGHGLRGTVFRRSMAVLSHEVGHLFGLAHCVYFECLMKGSNSLEESDARPIHLCPVCLLKLQSSVGFDPATRARALAGFYASVGLDGDAAWVERWLVHVEGK